MEQSFHSSLPAESSDASSRNGEWVPLLEYAVRTGTSVSTIRRHIKSKKLRFRSENGRYQIWIAGGAPNAKPTVLVANPYLPPSSASVTLADEIKRLKEKLERAHTEIAELKTLIAYYESAQK